MDEDLKNKIKDANDIVDVVGEFISLRKMGVNYVGMCPFHGDSHPSLMVSKAKQICKCFACGKGGDVYTFVMEHEHMSFPEAAAYLAKRVGIEYEPTDRTPEQIERTKTIESLRIANKAAADYYHSLLPSASEYMLSRGYNLDDPDIQKTLALYSVGYAPEGNTLKKWAASSGYAHANILAAGLLKKGEHGTFDAFQGRITFPFFDLHGNIAGFTGRILIEKEKVAKYSNTGDTLLFSKGKLIYGLYQAKTDISKKDYAYLVEGQTDVLSMHLAGVANVFAGSGTAFTDDQINTVKRFTSNIILAYDADSAGIKASLKHAHSFLRQGFSVKCVLLPEGKDPDNIAQEKGKETGKYLLSNAIDFVTYFYDILRGDSMDVDHLDSVLQQVLDLIGQIESPNRRAQYCAKLAKLAEVRDSESLVKSANSIYKRLPELPDRAEVPDGIYGLEALSDFDDDADVHLTSDYDTLLLDYGENPTLYIKGAITATQVQELRRTDHTYCIDYSDIEIKFGEDSSFTSSIAACVRAGLYVMVNIPFDKDEDEKSEGEESEVENTSTAGYRRESFINCYVEKYSYFIASCKDETTPYIERCAELISYCSDSQRLVNMDKYKGWLGITKQALTAIIKPYLDRRKSSIAISAQRMDDLVADARESEDDEYPSYVGDNDEYLAMFREKSYYPIINKDGDPVCYMFVENNQRRQVADFYLVPLLHIYSDNKDENKRVFRVNRRFYTKPLYIELQSKSLTKLASMEDELIMLEGVNFSNGEDKHWKKIKEFMSRRYVYCTEITTYGNQQKDGMSLKEDENFYAFSNGIFHQIEGMWRFDAVNELGIVQHNKQNYYLPAFSTIYAGNGSKSDKYEIVSTLMYREIPSSKRVTFDEWADLMDRVYKINNNGKWALLFAVMCAFRINIYEIDRLFTAPFFMGPMSSGKTQIAISIRSLFISPKVPIFNLNIGTDAAMSTLMSTFRDAPIVLDEYNNNDISAPKFQAIKGIVYDGDGKQKRKGTGGREIENDKVYAPVIICGQETPQRDDNALMSRIIVCEVPKPSGPRSSEELELFDRLKEIEDPDKVGLSNVLLDVLELRPLVMKHFRTLKKSCYMELKEMLASVGEIDRLMKTASLFLAMCKLIEDMTDLQLPFTYAEFFKIALDKIKFQSELISKTDKLATFFKAMDVMIDTKAVIDGRDFAIEEKQKLSIMLSGKEKKDVTFQPGTRILFLRVSNIYTMFSRSSYNKEDSTQSTIDQNLRSHPSYIGIVSSRRFTWSEVEDVPNGTFGADPEQYGENNPSRIVDNRVTKRLITKNANTSCVAINYNIFRELYDIDLERKANEESNNEEAEKLPF